MKATAEGITIELHNYRYMGLVDWKLETGRHLRVPMTGTIAQWLQEGKQYELELKREENVGFDDFTLKDRVTIWPLFRRTYEFERTSPFSGRVLYRYRVVAREARYERDYEAIVELEQYHYASDEEILARWHCERCREFVEANIRPTCPRCRTPMRFQDLKDATRASRFLVLQLLDRESYEPEYVGYIRVDPPVPLLHRRLPDGTIERNIRNKIFPAWWFKDPFRPTEGATTLEEWWKVQGEVLKTTRSPVSRLARVVVHPDYRADGLGGWAVRIMLDWVKSRWIPEMRVPKEAVECIAMMARYNPFLERSGFRYLFDSRQGRPVLYYPLSERAQEAIETFLKNDPVAKEHQGRLHRSRFAEVDRLQGPIVLKEVTKAYSSHLTVEDLSGPVREVLEAFGVRQRVVQKYVIRKASATIQPGTVNVLLGASGSGKTTFLRMLYGAATGTKDPLYQPDSGSIRMPKNVSVQVHLPGELEPQFGEKPILETIYKLTQDESLAIEILNYAGISDAVLYRAPYRELSTGQKARAQLAWMLAHRPNLLLIDEFAAHLDPATALRVARKLADLARNKGITLVLVCHRPELIEVLEPDNVFVVGYGTFYRQGDLPERGFRVLEPYASYIVEGKKTWELRRRPTNIRGRVGIVSGDQVIGSVEIVDSIGPLTQEQLEKHQDKHLADKEFLKKYARGEPLYVWVLSGARKFDKPIPIQIRQGHQTWLNLVEATEEKRPTKAQTSPSPSSDKESHPSS